MKTCIGSLAVLVTLFLFPLSAAAAVPQTINYQGFLTDSGGTPVNGTVSMVFSLYNVQTGGSALWTETQATVSVNKGVYSVILGSATPISLSFDTQYYLGITVGADPEMTPRQTLTSAPYAMRAKVADVNVNKAGDAMTGPLTISTGSSHAFAVTQTGNNLVAGYFGVNNASNLYPAIVADSAGTGVVALFTTGNSSRTEPVLRVEGNSGPAAVLYGDVDMHGAVNVYGTLNSTGEINGYHTGSAWLNGLNVADSTTLNDLSVGYVFAQTMDIVGGLVATGEIETRGLTIKNTGITIEGGSLILSNGGAILSDGGITGTSLNISGTKNFIQPHPKDPSKQLSYVAMEGPESAIFLRGTAMLVNGKVIIATPEYFRAVAGVNDITVQFTPRSAKSKGLAATKVTKDNIVVSELMNGKGTYEFDYFITAKRSGFEKHEPVQRNTYFSADLSTKEDFEKKYSKTDEMSVLAIRNLLISNGILTADGKLNMVTAQKLGWTVKEAELASSGVK